ncbi:ABC transporter substrate-binding protein [Azohydromonas lata]|uniref:ABC transporter substrate-binding protein n=1 Tax=Azohydromonas lata TaxID=45677 RepID=A0ABU5IHS6_9BURK|nr:ABC transporter substrate-binding protein [Azohydromonas lata]MDZ5458046.1 ABC transporter substrate-binding protein [Azohydromonas lata]
MKPPAADTPPLTPLTRRQLLGGAGAAALVTAGAGLGAHRVAAAQSKPLTLAWNANAICLAPVPVADQLGFFKKHGVKVELTNFSGSTDALLESIANGKADAGVGMVHRWLKALEQGFDVKITGASHGGCTRMAGLRSAGVTDLQKLKGKTIGVSDLASPGKNFFAILLTRHGIDPNKDVEWRQYPADLLGLAVEKGEIQAIADGDPNLYLIQKRNKDLVELATNLFGDYADKTCCVLGVRGSLVRGDKATAAALTRAIVEASDWVANNPNESARIFTKFSPVPEADLRAVLGTLTHNHHPSGIALRQQIEFYARDFKTIGVFKPGTDPAKFANHVVADVLA